MVRLYIVCGAPGSGKSTFISRILDFNEVIVSRDKIRFSLLKENDGYFSKENEVWKIFTETINKELQNGNSVFADATHLNKKSRKKLLDCIDKNNYDELIAVWVDTPLETALSRNAARQDPRTVVPESALIRMYNSFEEPTFEEGFNIIYHKDTIKGFKVVRKR